MKRKLKSLSEYEYNKLKEMGFLFELYGEATGNWNVDCFNSSLSKDELLVFNQLFNAYDKLDDNQFNEESLSIIEDFIDKFKSDYVKNKYFGI